MTRHTIGRQRREILWATSDHLIAEFLKLEGRIAADKEALDDTDERHLRMFLTMVRALDGLCRLVERQGSQDEMQTMKTKLDTLEDIQRRLARLATRGASESLSGDPEQ